jgi:hypothetical protein
VRVAPESGPVKSVRESSYLVNVKGFACVYEVTSSESASPVAAASQTPACIDA